MSGTFRDERDAAFAQADALRQRVTELEAENARLRGESAQPPVAPPASARSPGLFVLGALLAIGLIAAVFWVVERREDERRAAARVAYEASASEQAARAREAAQRDADRARALAAEQAALAQQAAARQQALAAASGEELGERIRRSGAVSTCWGHALRADPSHRAEVLTLGFEPDARGVDRVRSHGAEDDAVLTRCVEDGLATLRREPGDVSGATVTVRLNPDPAAP
jgi:hypothetical protein